MCFGISCLQTILVSFQSLHAVKFNLVVRFSADNSLCHINPAFVRTHAENEYRKKFPFFYNRSKVATIWLIGYFFPHKINPRNEMDGGTNSAYLCTASASVSHMDAV